jgi:hypothetical protein
VTRFAEGFLPSATASSIAAAITVPLGSRHLVGDADDTLRHFALAIHHGRAMHEFDMIVVRVYD